jgi:Zn-dependent protease with chaperone function
MNGMLLLIFFVSFCMLVYLFFDFIFGFSVKSALKKATRYDENENYAYLDLIFSQVKEKFGERGAKLYIKHVPEMNAFAIGVLGRKYIALTDGLIKHYHDNTANEEEFLVALRSIMAHEMSHLINKDFLPALIIVVNQRITNFVADLLSIGFRIGISVFTFFRINSRLVSSVMVLTYNVTNWLITAFNHYVVYSVYEFLRRFVSRSIEYRCDRQAAKAFGGHNMAFALSFVGRNGYFTIFSTHPATNRRIEKIKNIKEIEGTIRAPFSSVISNYISIMFLLVICLGCARNVGVDVLVRNYLNANHNEIYFYAKKLLNLVKNFIYDISL